MTYITRQEYEQAVELIKAYRDQLITEIATVIDVSRQLEKAPLSLGTPLDKAGLTCRPYRALRLHGIETVADIAKMGRERVGKIRNLGKGSLAEIERLMENAGATY